MKYVAITKDEMLQGEGLRVALWVSGCEVRCKGCHNAGYWDKNFGIVFDGNAILEIYDQLSKPYIAGLSILGGNPTEDYNINDVCHLCSMVKRDFPDKTIWVWSGHVWEQIKNLPFLEFVDVLCDGEYIEALADVNYHWCGSTNQRVIDVQKSLETGEVILYEKE